MLPGAWMRAVTAALLGCALLLCTTSAEALSLSWSAPSECLTSAQLRARIDALLASHDLAQPDVAVSGRVERNPNGEFALTLEVRSQDAQRARTLRDRDCLALSEAAAWLVVLAGEAAEPAQAAGVSTATGKRSNGHSAAADTRTSGSANGEQTETKTEPAAEPTQEAERKAEAPASVEETRPESTTAPATKFESHLVRDAIERLGARWYRVALLGGVWQASMPSAQLAVGGRLGVARGPLYGELRGFTTLARTHTLDDAGTVRVATHGLALAGCGQWGERLRWGPCARLSGMLSIGTVSGITAPERAEVLWLVSELALLAGLKLAGPFEVLLDGSVGLPLTSRPRFYVDGYGDVSRASVLSAQASLSLGVRWP